ncbi:MAG: hypothetical protein KIS61_09955 [Candidatus Eremiobacteraeota bacterium]|nr:hypothetical protein [Candidatus Eremiobacteraeota bacterium]
MLLKPASNPGCIFTLDHGFIIAVMIRQELCTYSLVDGFHGSAVLQSGVGLFVLGMADLEPARALLVTLLADAFGEEQGVHSS